MFIRFNQQDAVCEADYAGLETIMKGIVKEKQPFQRLEITKVSLLGYSWQIRMGVGNIVEICGFTKGVNLICDKNFWIQDFHVR